jgi:hypothetical protein
LLVTLFLFILMISLGVLTSETGNPLLVLVAMLLPGIPLLGRIALTCESLTKRERMAIGLLLAASVLVLLAGSLTLLLSLT